jgi:hypothetical protein
MYSLVKNTKMSNLDHILYCYMCVCVCGYTTLAFTISRKTQIKDDSIVKNKDSNMTNLGLVHLLPSISYGCYIYATDLLNIQIKS